jgi:hypothetical protein
MARLEEFLGSSGIEDDTIKLIMQVLEEDADAIAQAPPGAVPPTAFGASDSGSDLGTHTSLAHEYVTTALKEMVAGLLGYRINIDRWQCDVNFTDEDAAVAFQGIEKTGLCTDYDASRQTTTTCDPSVAATGGA